MRIFMSCIAYLLLHPRVVVQAEKGPTQCHSCGVPPGYHKVHNHITQVLVSVLPVADEEGEEVAKLGTGLNLWDGFCVLRSGNVLWRLAKFFARLKCFQSSDWLTRKKHSMKVPRIYTNTHLLMTLGLPENNHPIKAPRIHSNIYLLAALGNDLLRKRVQLLHTVFDRLFGRGSERPCKLPRLVYAR